MYDIFGTFFRTRTDSAAINLARLSAQAEHPNDISLTGQPLAYLPSAQATEVAGLNYADWHARDAERQAAILANEAATTVQSTFRVTPLAARQAAMYARAAAEPSYSICSRCRRCSYLRGFGCQAGC